MRKIVANLILFIVTLFIILIIILTTIGIETNKFNKLISEKISQRNNINLKLETIKFKINPKELSLFLETQNPEIMYKDILVPITNVKVYIDFLTLFKPDLIIKKISLRSEQLDIIQISKLSKLIKPSSFKNISISEIILPSLILLFNKLLKVDGLISLDSLLI